jgi:cytochrome P450
MCELQNYIIPHIREREARPREDLMSDLVHARLEDDRNPALSFEEKVSCIRAFLIAGNDTTAAALANLMMILATQPALARKLYESADDDRMLSRFVEEVLRLEPPSHGLYRTAMREVRLGDTLLPAYAQVCILFASANDDDTQFPSPRSLDVGRPNISKHLTFGAGIHLCIGAALARMEIKVAAREIIKRLDNIRLAIPAAELTYLPTLATQTLERLPLTFSRRV